MLKAVFFVFTFLAFNSNGQVISGELKDSGRKMISEEDFVIESHVSGSATYEITVNEKGNVTGMRLLSTDVKSTPARYYLENHIKKLKFEQHVLYPKFHRCVVKFTLVKGS